MCTLSRAQPLALQELDRETTPGRRRFRHNYPVRVAGPVIES
jgi:hypothetical protein